MYQSKKPYLYGTGGGVQDVPLALNVGLVCHKSGHGLSSISRRSTAPTPAGWAA